MLYINPHQVKEGGPGTLNVTYILLGIPSTIYHIYPIVSYNINPLPSLPRLQTSCQATSAMKCFPFLQGVSQLTGTVHGSLEFSITKREAVQLPVYKLHQFLILQDFLLNEGSGQPHYALALCGVRWKFWKFNIGGEILTRFLCNELSLKSNP